MSGFSFNGFVAGDTPATFTDFRVSPVRMIREGTDAEAIEVCSPAGRAFWSIYGDTGAGWRLVHDAEADDAGLALAALSGNAAARFEYADLETVPVAGTLADLADRLAERIHDEIPGYDNPEDFRGDDFDAHPLSELREQILEAIESEAAA